MQESIILIFLVIVTVLLKLKYKLVFYHSEKERILTSLVILVVMINWEHYSVTHNVWTYPGSGLSGIYIWMLPIELYAFYIVLPYFVFSIFDIVHKRLDKTI